MNGRGKNVSIVESIDTAEHKQLVNSIRKRNHERSLNFWLLEFVLLRFALIIERAREREAKREKKKKEKISCACVFQEFFGI